MKSVWSKEVRPKLNIEIKLPDRVFEFAGYTFTILMWVLAFCVIFSDLDKIPSHFSFSGRPDSYGSKYTILVIPVIHSLVFVLLTVINRYPHIFNYPIKITNENALRQYSLATRAIRYLKTTLSLLFLSLTYLAYISATSDIQISVIWIFPVIIIMIEIPMLFYIWKAMKK